MSPNLATLSQLVADLYYRSEIDAPYHPCSWQLAGDLNLPAICQQFNLDPKAAITPLDVDTFFRNEVRPQSWHSPAAATAVQRHQTLVAWLKAHLHPLQVYKVGQTEIEALIVGQTDSGECLALRVQIVET